MFIGAPIEIPSTVGGTGKNTGEYYGRTAAEKIGAIFRMPPEAGTDFNDLPHGKIIEIINPVAYRLDLPPTMKIHPVFHVSLLQPVDPDFRVDVQPPPVIVDDTLEYEVSSILDSRIRRNRLEYLVHWKGYGPSERTWEPSANLANSKELVQAFHQQYPKRPGPLSSKRMPARGYYVMNKSEKTIAKNKLSDPAMIRRT
jgi:hypothetical protein